MQKQYVIFGCGSQSKYVVENLMSNDKSNAQSLRLVDLENKFVETNKANDIEIIKDTKYAIELVKNNNYSIVIAHGNNKLKEETFYKLNLTKNRFINAIHSNSSISKNVTMGEGNIINSGSIVLPDAKIGSHIILHSGTIIEHDCVINNFVNIAPGVVLAGGVEIVERMIFKLKLYSHVFGNSLP